MIPCKMPDNTLATLSETLNLLEKASELTQQLIAENNDVERQDQYLMLALGLEQVQDKAVKIWHDLK